MTSKNFSLRRSLSRSGTRVSTELASMVTSTVDLETSLSSNMTEPVTLLKAPRTVEMARWRTENCAEECAGSICQLELAAAAGSERVAARPAVRAIREKMFPICVPLLWLIAFLKLVPRDQLLKLARANLLQQTAENFKPGCRHVPELPLVQFVDWLVKGFQETEGARRDARLDDAAIVNLTFAGDEAVLFHAVKKAGHVWIVRNHPVADSTARQAFGLGTAKDAKDVVLGAGEAGGFQQLLRLLGESVGGLQESDKNPVLRGQGHARRFGGRTHAPSIVVITTTVKRKKSTPRCHSAPPCGH